MPFTHALLFFVALSEQFVVRDVERVHLDEPARFTAAADGDVLTRDVVVIWIEIADLLPAWQPRNISTPLVMADDVVTLVLVSPFPCGLGVFVAPDRAAAVTAANAPQPQPPPQQRLWMTQPGWDRETWTMHAMQLQRRWFRDPGIPLPRVTRVMRAANLDALRRRHVATSCGLPHAGSG